MIRAGRNEHGWRVLVAIIVVGMVTAATRGQTSSDSSAGGPRQLTGWGGGKADDVVAKAADVGFTQLVVHHDDAVSFTRFIELGREHGIGIYAWQYLGDVAAWKKMHPDVPPPLQVMSEAEEAALKRIEADKTPDKSRYQFGGEPVQELEVLVTPLLCFHDPRVAELFEKQIEEMLAFEGVRGVALDYIGYRNYRCCRCPTSQAQLAAYQKEHPQLTAEQALDAFSLETLVAFNNRLSAHVRKIDAKARVITHVYPVYLPQPLYGNRLDVDECGQTAAWFFEPFWSREKITRYSRIIAEEAKVHHRHAEGVAMIGYFKKPVKSPEVLAGELEAILAGGCTRVQVCSFNDVLNVPEAAAVFRRFFGRSAGSSRRSGE